MAKTKKTNPAVSYPHRLLEDEYVQEQLRRAASGLRAAYDRARMQRGQATEDKRVYASLRQAATSMRNATLALQRQEPKPKGRRIAKVAILTFAVGATAWLTLQLQKQHSAANQPDASAVPGVATAGATPGASPPETEPDQHAAATPPHA